MIDLQSLPKAFIALLLTVASMNTDAAIFGIGGKSMTWHEEVLLHDGQIIVAERSYNLDGFPTIESRERSALDETVIFNLPGTKQKIIWKTDFRDAVPEPNSLNLLLLDIVKGVPYIVTYPAGCIAYGKWKRPNPPYVPFKYEDGEWTLISMSELPTELSRPNVIVGRPATSLLKTYYTAEQVEKENRDIHQPEYKTILREQLANAGSGCGEMVYDGHGGWTGIGWFKKQPSREACLKYCERENIGVQYCPCETLFKGK